MEAGWVVETLRCGEDPTCFNQILFEHRDGGGDAKTSSLHPYSHSKNYLVKLSKHLTLSCACFEVRLEILNTVSEAIMKRQRFTYTVKGP